VETVEDELGSGINSVTRSALHSVIHFDVLKKMKILQQLFGSKELKAAYGAIDELDVTLNNPAYKLVRAQIEPVLKDDSADIISLIKNGTTPRNWALCAIANVSGDLIETGNYHLHRGVLNPLGEGPNLLKLYHDAIDESVKAGATDEETSQRIKSQLDDIIKKIG